MFRAILIIAVSLAVWVEAQTTGTEACERALNITNFILEQVASNPLAGELLKNASEAYDASQPVTTDLLQYMPQVSWAAFQAEAVLGAANWGGAQVGEVMNVLNVLNSTDQLGDVTRFSGDNITEAFDIWLGQWVKTADDIIERASKIDDPRMDKIKADMLFRASQYYFVANWPFPVSDASLSAVNKSSAAFKEYLSLKEKTDGFKVFTDLTIPFSNGTVDVDLPAVFVTPDATKRLPLIILNTGTDYPIPAIWAFGGAEAVKNGYAVLAFEGPGQGEVKRNPPYMRLVPRWDTVIDAVLTEGVENNSMVRDLISTDDIFLFGVSLGGYLAGQACSMLDGGRLKGCVLSPAVTSMLLPYSEEFVNVFFLPFADYPELPPEFADALRNMDSVTEQVLKPLLLECDEDSGARQVWSQLFGEQTVDQFPDVVYNVIDYQGGGAGFSNKSVAAMVDAAYDGWGRVFEFVNPNISSTATPVLVLAGDQDTLMGGQQNAYFDQLPGDVREDSLLVTFDGESGGALHSQAGAGSTQFEAIMPWIMGLLSEEAGSSVKGGDGGVDSGASGVPGGPTGATTSGASLVIHSVVGVMTLHMVAFLF